MKSVLVILLLLNVTMLRSVALATEPNPSLTPGELCTPSNPDFAGYRYTAHIAYCTRNVSQEEKQKVAEAYGNIPESEWVNYEFDHLIPLNAGGDSSINNIWPQPKSEALQKDVVEQQVFDGLSAGTLTQDQAIQMIRDWIAKH